tara:strand:+ start:3339 stop:3773 length:435 start_codon:yes stop_codon:yes gene_type:complete
MLYIIIKIVCDKNPEFVFFIITYIDGNKTQKLKDKIMRYKEKTDYNDKSSKYYNNGLYKMLRENDGWNNLKWIYEAETEIPLTYTKEDIQEVTSKIILEFYDRHDSIVYDNSIKYICNCGGLFTIKTKTRHEKTKLHQKHIKDL